MNARSLIPLAGLMLLAGCNFSDANETTKDAELVRATMPPGLKDCRIYRVRTEDNITILITRCPHSETTTQYGKGVTSAVSEVDLPEDVEEKESKVHP